MSLDNGKEKIRVLFVCVQNSFRSQIAESILNQKYGDQFIAESAGLTIGTINPLAIQVMKEIGIDISGNSIDSVFDFYKEGRLYRYVITVCDRESEKNCPVFPGVRERINWNIDDPAMFERSTDEKYQNAVTPEILLNKRLKIY